MPHTKGPWTVEKCSCGNRNCTKYGIKELYISNDKLGKGDAQLIAAAPELLAACEKVLLHYYLGDLHSRDYSIMKAAVNKARGFYA